MLRKDNLRIRVSANRGELGKAAAAAFSACIQKLRAKKAQLNIVFAAAPSQLDFLAAIVNDPQIDWPALNAFHMDEYLGLPADAPQLFSRFLDEHLFSRVPFHAVQIIRPENGDAAAEAARYAALLNAHPPDIVCMGIGENTHIAFNDPHVADFDDPETVKIVRLDEACRQQQVNDGCFATLADVPGRALTLTIPALLSAPVIFCMVPGKNKAQAVARTLHAEISERYPSTILRRHADATLFLDADSASALDLTCPDPL